VIAFARIVLLLLADLVGLVRLAIRPRRSIEAENLVLRRQLALYKERGVKPRRIDAATRVSLAWIRGGATGARVWSSFVQKLSSAGTGQGGAFCGATSLVRGDHRFRWNFAN
jgi:hypothetical protein